MKEGDRLVSNGIVIAEFGSNTTTEIDYPGRVSQLKYPYDFFQKNEEELQKDYQILTQDQKSEPLSDTNRVIGKEVFVAAGAKVSCAILNSETGPIFIDEGAEIMEGTMVRGPLYLGKNSQIKMGAKVYGATTIGPGCKVGGEISNVVFFGNSNKGHDGFLGNAVIAEWCNLGADTNSSNLKNNYAKIDLYNYFEKKYIKTDLTFCGLIMGDHSKAGINTMFNTSTVVGICANVYGADFLPKHIPSFSWGSSQKLYEYKIEKALETMEIVMARRNKKLSDRDREILNYIFENKSSF
jgi:UDP-N-acetylglucosamine diphosphorylase/glucosamine-1-phosphate N-acetyltransferase